MADKPGLPAGGGDDAGSIMALLERVAGLMDSVQTTQQRMEERQLELENTVKTIQTDIIKLTNDHANTSSTVDRLLEKTRKVSRHIKDVRVRVENQNVRVKKVEATQGDLLAKNKFRVVIYQGDQEVKAVTPGSEPAESSGAAAARAEVEPDKFELPPESDEEYMVVEEADSSAAGRAKKTGLTRIESFKATFSKENMSSKVNKLGERIVTAERREKIRQSGERLKQSGERLKETITKNVPAKLNLKKERTVAEGQEGAEGASEGAMPVPPPKGRKTSPRAARAADDEGKSEESEVPMYDMKQLS
ncbi:Muscle-related coiled-coil protein [Oryzias melastigma]|uniref:Caveolae associated protein 4b n=1 Tax=Oryzias melastigma TaxID=30732 RepID=A0A3B3B4D1_ORYME|nr:caveolae-associated protein 4b [Oryzias melastigma]KAF6729653.1 Muscle-related coiled-coil protein [Oryzias melastigma]